MSDVVLNKYIRVSDFMISNVIASDCVIFGSNYGHLTWGDLSKLENAYVVPEDINYDGENPITDTVYLIYKSRPSLKIVETIVDLYPDEAHYTEVGEYNILELWWD